MNIRDTINADSILRDIMDIRDVRDIRCTISINSILWDIRDIRDTIRYYEHYRCTNNINNQWYLILLVI